MDPIRLVSDLDDLQRRAVTTPAAPLRILAGAGSGKTRVLTRRIAHRVATNSAEARHVLALTFTRKAAGELRARLGHLGLRDDLAAGTFHAVAYAQLRTLWADRNQNPWSLVERKVPLVAELLPSRQRGRTPVVEVVGEIEWAKARMIPPGGYEEAARTTDRRPGVTPGVVVELWEAYEEAKRRRRLLDFDDLLDGWRRALERRPDFAAAQRWRFRHVFVDEFQDVNPLQHAVLAALLGDSADLCVVGDPRQAIYAWNGAEAQYLVDFERWWPGAATVELVDNYRSSPQILAVATSVLTAAPGTRRRGAQPDPAVTGGAATHLRAHRPEGPVPSVAAHPDDRAEAAAVARRIRDRHQPGRPWGRQAVLVRTNAQTTLIEQALRAVGIPCRIKGGSGLLGTPEVRQALRDLRRSRGDFAAAQADLRAMVDAAAAEVPPQLEGSAAEEDQRVANLMALQRLSVDFAAMVPYPSVSAFASWLATSTGGDDAEGGDAVDVATFHAAKGLEWPVVHLAGLEEGLVPIGHARTAGELAEERRLFYVAVTRAEEELHCTWTQERTFGERTVPRKRSPFLSDAEAAGALGGTPRVDQPPPRKRRREPAGQPPESDTPEGRLHEQLRAWRLQQAQAARVPAYTVFNDRTLEDLVARQPTDLDELLAIRGFGPVKAHRFGQQILDIIDAAR